MPQGTLSVSWNRSLCRKWLWKRLSVDSGGYRDRSDLWVYAGCSTDAGMCWHSYRLHFFQLPFYDLLVFRWCFVMFRGWTPPWLVSMPWILLLASSLVFR